MKKMGFSLWMIVCAAPVMAQQTGAQRSTPTQKPERTLKARTRSQIFSELNEAVSKFRPQYDCFRFTKATSEIPLNAGKTRETILQRLRDALNPARKTPGLETIFGR